MSAIPHAEPEYVVTFMPNSADERSNCIRLSRAFPRYHMTLQPQLIILFLYVSHPTPSARSAVVNQL